MSLQYNDTSTARKGIVQIYEKEAGYNYGDVSGDSSKLKDFTADANLAHDELLEIGFAKGSLWQPDDSNHTDYPIIFTDLVSGRRDYPFIVDGSGNLILDIYRVMVADSTGVFKEIFPVNQDNENSNGEDTTTLIDGRNQTGIPTRYTKVGNSILLDYIPNYNYSRGLKVFINREGSYFDYQDTLKKPGVPGSLHRWYAIRPALDKAGRDTNSKNYERLSVEVERMRVSIGRVFGQRAKDMKNRAKANVENNK